MADTGTSEPARCLIEVSAGLLPGQADAEYTRRYAITSSEWEKAGDGKGLLLLEKYAMAHAYALSVLDPSRVNWVQVNWIWL